MKKILQVVTSLELGGTEAYIFNHYRKMKDAVYDFLVFTEKKYPYDDEIRSRGGNIYYCGYPTVNNLRNFIGTVRKCIRNNGEYAAVHAHTDINNAWVMYAAYKENVPVRVTHAHDVPNQKKDPYTGFRKYINYRFSTCRLACSDEAGRYLYGNKAFDIMHNGIDTDMFTKESAAEYRKEYAIADDALVIGNISRFEPKKNQMFMLKIFKETVKRYSNSVLVLGGVDGGQLRNVMKKAEEMKISDKVRFIGERTDVPDWMKIFDIYLMPSLYEGLGIALLEAQASGVYCVASSAVPKEADMGLRLIDFISLDNSPEQWAERIIEKRNYTKPDIETVKRAFEDKGYDIEKGCGMLKNIYGLI